MIVIIKDNDNGNELESGWDSNDCDDEYQELGLSMTCDLILIDHYMMQNYHI